MLRFFHNSSIHLELCSRRHHRDRFLLLLSWAWGRTTSHTSFLPASSVTFCPHTELPPSSSFAYPDPHNWSLLAFWILDLFLTVTQIVLGFDWYSFLKIFPPVFPSDWIRTRTHLSGYRALKATDSFVWSNKYYHFTASLCRNSLRLAPNGACRGRMFLRLLIALETFLLFIFCQKNISSDKPKGLTLLTLFVAHSSFCLNICQTDFFLKTHWK